MNANVIVADIRYTDWLISHDLHMPAHWVKRWGLASEKWGGILALGCHSFELSRAQIVE
ncbi:hypothetical protein [Brucella intermedia]|uniref:hypothetical protein n=1 Tax=Brucella intermedia TaxID=94625 RepID=UPI00244834B3|nr:hypothetical protein [Brucella intermedia]WGG62592.1 hypothetical protein QA414_19810 [Brucella intermedia]